MAELTPPTCTPRTRGCPQCRGLPRCREASCLTNHGALLCQTHPSQENQETPCSRDAQRPEPEVVGGRTKKARTKKQRMLLGSATMESGRFHRGSRLVEGASNAAPRPSGSMTVTAVRRLRHRRPSAPLGSIVQGGCGSGSVLLLLSRCLCSSLSAFVSSASVRVCFLDLLERPGAPGTYHLLTIQRGKDIGQTTQGQCMYNPNLISGGFLTHKLCRKFTRNSLVKHEYE